MLRTWIEIDASAAKENYRTFRSILTKGAARGGGTRHPELWSVVKSNAYGHGIYDFARLMDGCGVDGFCVDSVVEGLSLRREGIRKPILVLGQTLASRYAEAARNDITVTVSNSEALRAMLRVGRTSRAPEFHVKIDTGMHRQGFYPEEIGGVARELRGSVRSRFRGVYTHFASAKDLNYPTYTDRQLKNFKTALAIFEQAGFRSLIRHAAATGGALISPDYHWDAVRVGIGLYGLWPSKELEVQLGDAIRLRPVLSWRTVVGEVKRLRKGDYIGYDLTERAPKDMTMAVLPIGYWHGFPRALSSSAEVLVGGRRTRVLGRVSMDMVAVAVPPATRTGAVVTIIGRDGREEIAAAEQAARAGTIHYEFLTRLNPLMERIIMR